MFFSDHQLEDGFSAILAPNVVWGGHPISNTPGLVKGAAKEVGSVEALKNAHPIRIAEFMGGRYSAYLALKKAGIKEWPEMMERLGRVPIWPEGFVGSISHSRQQAIAVASSTEHYMGLGIDIEPLLTESNAIALARYFMVPDEKVVDLRTQPYSGWVSLLVSMKESIYKACHQAFNINLNFQNICISDVDWKSGVVSIMLRFDQQAPWQALPNIPTGRFFITNSSLISLVTVGIASN
ncbi:MAG: 4'-phosphopantetheinyl transferase family protein [Cuniculiplasma sp.]